MASERFSRFTRLPVDWDTSNDEYEYAPLRLPRDVSRVSASLRLAISAEFHGWELTRLRLYPDGSRRVLLRRRKTGQPVPHPTVR
ncbi:DUF5703 family protein [Rhodococcus coprophilus]|uniref:Dihydroorotate dehydrogenase n=1 Tax=Rhodococcus coprophilus TaxID=38310 RepID=A0A2X4TMY2_9NOCA|nr:DUF5703 family protein [Rhodococcus coprophilus]MBM7460962.1 hypothetical protein [Rhodococcus coprophilus]SQI28766.1 Uncharacterised protein [Rhodococcus coprophilus]